MIFNVAGTRNKDVYEFYIDKSLLATSPTSCVVYKRGLTKAQALTKVWEWLNPSVVQNGSVNYFLNKTNLEEKTDGTASDLTGTDGDVMVSIPPLYWKVTVNDSDKLQIKLSPKYFAGSTNAHTFSGTVRKYLHIGMFHMSNGTAQSVYDTTNTPWTNQTCDAFREAAELLGDTYCSMTFRTWTLLQILSVFASGSVNSQASIGQDYTNGSGLTAVATAPMLTANGYTAVSAMSNTDPLMWMFFSELWGNACDFLAGIKSYSGNMGIAKDQNDARGNGISGDIPASWENFAQTGLGTGYIKEVAGESEYPFLPVANGGSASTYYCDTAVNQSGNRAVLVGGDYSAGTRAGIMTFFGYYDSASVDAGTSARIQCLDEDDA